MPWPAVALRPDHTIAHVNLACRDGLGGPSRSMRGRPLAELGGEWNCAELIAALTATSDVPREIQIPGHPSLRVLCTPMPPCDLGPEGMLLFIDDRRAHGRLEVEVDELNERLERALSQRTAKVHEQAVQLRELTGELLEAESRERERLAETLHDHLQQLIVAAQLRLHTLDKHPPPERAAALGEEVRELLQQAIDVTRSLAIELSPPLPSGSGLVAGLRWIAHHFRQQYGLTVHLHLHAVPPDVPSTLHAFIIRAVRELLFNVVKHAGVDEASLTLHGNGSGSLHLRIEDRGRGCGDMDGADARIGFGIAVIRQRAVALGGQCTFTSGVDRGCTVSIDLPLAPAPASA